MASVEPVVYILGTFPQASQTFIAREVRGLLAAGFPLHVFGLRRRSPDALEPADGAWFDRVRFVPFALAPPVIAANAHWLRAEPRRYLHALASIVLLPHRPRVLAFRAVTLWFVAGWIARQVEREGGCRQVHAHFALAQTEVAMVVAALLDRPFSFTAHARDIYATPSGLAEKMRAARMVVTCTAYNAEFLRHLCSDLPPERVKLVHHGVDVGTFAPWGVTAADGPPLILGAGRLVDKKGFDVLVRACALLRNRGVGFECRIAGDGPRRGALERAIAGAGLERDMTIAGWVDVETLARLLGGASVFVMPSRVTPRGDRDGIPNVVLEAMAAGLPVVATRTSGIPEAIDDGISGVLVPSSDPVALADALQQLIEDPVRRRAIGESARRRVIERFELAASAARLAALFGAAEPATSHSTPRRNALG